MQRPTQVENSAMVHFQWLMTKKTQLVSKISPSILPNISVLVVFIALDDDHLDQVIANIIQIKDRGATTIVLTNLVNIMDKISMKHINYPIQLDPNKSVLAAL